MSSQKKILVIATGGTIESFYGVEGDGGKNAPYDVPLTPPSVIPDALQKLELTEALEQLESSGTFKRPELIDAWKQLEPSEALERPELREALKQLEPSEALKQLERFRGCNVEEACISDSKGVNQTILNRIALYISEHASEYDGIVITHGTDTMPRNARMLEDMLETVGIPPLPIVFTGSMIPLRDKNKHWRTDSDGWENLKNALEDVRRHDAGVHIRMGEFFVSADKVDKSVELNDDIKKPNNTVRHGEFVDYDPKRWQPLTPYF